ncbi:MAG: ribosome biogenesis GTPase Der [Planctomycetes bacterium]|nr:ribosome biogenesis GTPase Der [Planctomycetota bacterium]
MPLPVIAIVGRPNVGKSSIFNMLAGRRTAIVEPTAGVTRDRVTAICDIDEKYFELVDTGGHGVVDRDDLSEHIERQIEYAIQKADIVLFVVDAREGLMPLDRNTAELLRPFHDRVRLVANKVDEPHMAAQVGEFIKLGFGEPITVSAANGSGRWSLTALIEQCLADNPNEMPVDPIMKIAVVGKRNAGKSSFINALAGEDRVIVSEVPGTTRDSIDVRFEKDNRTFVAIDTAGVRKKNKIQDDIEFYSHLRATAAIQRADIVLFLIDSTIKISQVDKRLGKLISSEHKPCILVVNKWDKAKALASSDDYGDYLSKVLPEIDYAPIAFTSAITGRNLQSTIDLATELFKQANTRIGTGKLNQILQQAISTNLPSPKRGQKSPKFHYATQVTTRPPTIVVFVNSASLVTQNYQRFLMNRFRESLPFDEIPIRLTFRSRRSGRS